MEEKKIAENEKDSLKEEEEIAKEKTFSKEELEKILETRLMRERKNAGELGVIKDMLQTLKQNGVIKSSSYHDMTKEVTELLLARLDAFAPNESGKNEENSAKTRNAKENEMPIPALTAPEMKAEPEKSGGTDSSYFEVAEFIHNFSEEEFKRILSDKVFLSFCAGRAGTLSQNYLAYFDLLEKLGKNEEAKKSKSAQNALHSTAFSRENAGYANDYSSLLTKRQMEIAKEAGMSYREYAELLGEIPTSDVIKRKKA